MKKGSCFVAIFLVFFLSELLVTEAVTCSFTELIPCVGVITLSQPPSLACCIKLRKQKPCLCGYLKNPSLKPYVNSPNAQKVAKTYGVYLSTPSC
ncbi:hypothetical protein R3W88_007678 [Solanum pinnatisectum]|uniref:Bifunctional inhibitor/plant lipid transfer protein/seed storage helical domain-containing protein n=1 Tax=Solanum pinnatisectum TaxID=50273 RepID=A0AAV9M6B9_9SOLN|nr:hypothetical protein R3W88_007678 [Solanum pinnatisectum]